MLKQLPFSKDQADTIALEALGFIAADDDRLQGFCLETGIALNDLRNRLTDRVVLGAILDHILNESPRLDEFCKAYGYNGETVVKARITMPGFSPEMRTVDNF